MDIKALREAHGLTRPAFAERFGIPYRTVQAWELGDRECPGYVYELIKYRLENEKVED